MAVNLTKKFQKKADQAYTLGSLTKSAFGAAYDFIGSATAVVYTLTSQAMGDYSRTGANRYGTPTELQDTTKEYSITKDRSFSITVDRGNELQQSVEKSAATVIGLQMSEQLFPEQDIYNLGVLTASAVAASQVPTPAALTASNAYASFLKLTEFLDNAKIPTSGRIAFVTPAVYNFMKLDPTFMKACDIAQNMLIKGQVGEIDGVKIVKAPASYFPTNTAIIITHPSANAAPMQLESTKVHVDPPGINGHLVEGRFMYDAFTLEQKKKACAAWKIA